MYIFLACLHVLNCTCILNYVYPTQNKCTRYWPDEDETKTYGNIHVLNLKERSNPHYVLREFLIHHDNVSWLVLLLTLSYKLVLSLTGRQ